MSLDGFIDSSSSFFGWNGSCGSFRWDGSSGSSIYLGRSLVVNLDGMDEVVHPVLPIDNLPIDTVGGRSMSGSTACIISLSSSLLVRLLVCILRRETCILTLFSPLSKLKGVP